VLGTLPLQRRDREGFSPSSLFTGIAARPVLVQPIVVSKIGSTKYCGFVAGRIIAVERLQSQVPF
jgi:hypothetical protein